MAVRVPPAVVLAANVIGLVARSFTVPPGFVALVSVSTPVMVRLPLLLTATLPVPVLLKARLLTAVESPPLAPAPLTPVTLFKARLVSVIDTLALLEIAPPVISVRFGAGAQADVGRDGDVPRASAADAEDARGDGAQLGVVEAQRAVGVARPG